jgi:hypothetical protein
LEVARSSRGDWAHAHTILTGFAVWRELVVHADLDRQVMLFLPGETSGLTSAA